MRPTRTATCRLALVFSMVSVLGPWAFGEDAPAKAAESPLVKMLRGGKVPEGRQGAIVEMIGKRGGSADLDFLLEKAVTAEGFPASTRLKALGALAEAGLTREVRPGGDLGRLGPVITSSTGDPAARLAAVKLAGIWKAEALGGALRTIAEAKESPADLRAQAIDALASIGGKAGRASIEALTRPDRPLGVRAEAVAALARIDPEAATPRALAVLRDAKGDEAEIRPILGAFLSLQGGSDKLAEAIRAGSLPTDAAKLALRSVYTLGRADAGLVGALTKAAGLDAEVKPPGKAEMDALIADVTTKGDPRRGEAIFRRADVNCAKCHAISGAGGGVGPELSAVGTTSPVDYLVNSIMLPDQAIKEEFHTLVVLTNAGQIYQGIVADKDEKRIILKEATGELRTIPTSEVEESKEGGSLMPKGLVNFLTRSEFVDLVRFLYELGKPGAYAIRSTPTIQRWRVLKGVGPELAKGVPDVDAFRSGVLDAEASRWVPAYARTAGELPLNELEAEAGGKVLYLQAEVDVSQAGEAEVALNDAEGVAAWVDGDPAPKGFPFKTNLEAGRHRLTFRVDAGARGETPLRAEVKKPGGSSAEYVVVGGR